jgi:hypothetical protein
MNKKNMRTPLSYFGLTLPLATNNLFFVASLVVITFLVFIFHMNFLTGLVATLISLGVIAIFPPIKQKRKRL